MADQSSDQERLHAALGFKRLNRGWAKLEILLGLTSAGAGILLGQWLFSRREGIEWTLVVVALLLMVLGGYLSLAGSRSHLYQSNNELTTYLVREIHRTHDKG